MGKSFKRIRCSKIPTGNLILKEKYVTMLDTKCLYSHSLDMFNKLSAQPLWKKRRRRGVMVRGRQERQIENSIYYVLSNFLQLLAMVDHCIQKASDLQAVHLGNYIARLIKKNRRIRPYCSKINPL